ncbi:hypothetical protein HOD29_05715 [archaeon]|jgi:hypothetical protein|nr:hypothetical protein [archaeon]
MSLKKKLSLNKKEMKPSAKGAFEDDVSEEEVDLANPEVMHGALYGSKVTSPYGLEEMAEKKDWKYLAVTEDHIYSLFDDVEVPKTVFYGADRVTKGQAYSKKK